ncbi:G-patch domain protein [Aphelenchoides besseyi]|nr:G-patch domain protein [Aphelenchoides besseyi]
MRFNDLNFTVRSIIYLISLFGGSYVIRQVGDSTANNLTGYKQGNRRRSVAIWRLLWIMAHLSVLVYMHLFSVFKSNHYTKEDKGRAYNKNCTPFNAKYQHRSLLVFWIVIIGAHLSYFLYTVNHVVPWLLFDFCNICTGNHETYYGNFAEWADLFKSYRIKVLSNEIVDVNGTCIVGLNDISGYKSGIVNASMDPNVIQQCSNSSPIVVLAHNPAATPKILKAAKMFDRHVDLILSGHTHAGQYYILTPFVYWILPYLYGSYNVGDGSTHLLVMSILAAPRRKQRLSIDPQNVEWINEASVGKRLMHQMGWNKGNGLGKNEQGQSENLKLKANLTGRGLGKDEHRSTEHWIAHQDNFETLLAQLNQKSTAKQPSVDLPNKESAIQTTKTIRSRNLRARFCRAKDLSIVCPTSKAGIFGIKSEQSTVEVRESDVEKRETKCKSNDDDKLIVTSKSAAEIYKEKMRKWSYFGQKTNDNLKKRDATTNDEVEDRPETKKKRRKFNS